jgi:hypothetical protein
MVGQFLAPSRLLPRSRSSADDSVATLVAGREQGLAVWEKNTILYHRYLQIG